MTSRGRTSILVALILAVSGCATVPPWERGNLAKPQMAFEQGPADSALRSHVYNSREAAATSTIGAGGGCGCY